MRKKNKKKGKGRIKFKENWIAFQTYINYTFESESYLFLILDRNSSKDDDTQIQFNQKNWVYPIAKPDSN
jgi:hypothetical protein